MNIEQIREECLELATKYYREGQLDSSEVKRLSELAEKEHKELQSVITPILRGTKVIRGTGVDSPDRVIKLR